MAASFSGQQLRSARLATGLSLRGLESKLRGEISAQSISLYERGEVTPRPELVSQLALSLGIEVSDLSQPTQAHVAGAWFVGGHDKASRLRNTVTSQLELSLPGLLSREAATGHRWTGPNLLPAVSETQPTSPRTVESGALALRNHWGLGMTSLPSLVYLLENRGVRVVEVEVDDFEGCVVDIEFRDEEDLVTVGSSFVVNPSMHGEQVRFSLAYCLAGFLYPRVREKQIDMAAQWFARAFLAPKALLQQYLGKERRNVGWPELLETKHALGIGIRDLILRCNEADIIDTQVQRALLKGAENQGWFDSSHREPNAIEPGTEKPKLIDSLLRRAGREQHMPLSEISRLLGVSVEELQYQLDDPSPLAR